MFMKVEWNVLLSVTYQYNIRIQICLYFVQCYNDKNFAFFSLENFADHYQNVDPMVLIGQWSNPWAEEKESLFEENEGGRLEHCYLFIHGILKLVR